MSTNEKEDDKQEPVIGLGLNTDLIGLNIDSSPASCDTNETSKDRY